MLDRKVLSLKSKSEYLALAKQCERRALQDTSDATSLLAFAALWRKLASKRDLDGSSRQSRSSDK